MEASQNAGGGLPRLRPPLVVGERRAVDINGEKHVAGAISPGSSPLPPFACGGVLVPDGDGWRRTCFVVEGGLTETLADVIYRSGKHPLQPSEDHYWPLSNWPGSTRMHTVHHYCQHVQGGLIRVAGCGPIVLSLIGLAASHAAGYPGFTRGRAIRASANYPELITARTASLTSRSAAGHPELAAGRITQAKAGYSNLAKAQCQRWNINRGKPCTCRQHG